MKYIFSYKQSFTVTQKTNFHCTCQFTQKKTSHSSPFLFHSSLNVVCDPPKYFPHRGVWSQAESVCGGCWRSEESPRRALDTEAFLDLVRVCWFAEGSGSSPGCQPLGESHAWASPRRDTARTTGVDTEVGPPGRGTMERSRVDWPGAVVVRKGQASAP